MCMNFSKNLSKGRRSGNQPKLGEYGRGGRDQLKTLITIDITSVCSLQYAFQSRGSISSQYVYAELISLMLGCYHAHMISCTRVCSKIIFEGES